MAKNRLDSVIEKFKNHRIISLFMLLGIALIAMAQIVSAIRSVTDFFKPEPNFSMEVKPVDTSVVLLLDVYTQNPEKFSRVATEARLVVDELVRREVVGPYGGHIPIAFQYHALMEPNDKVVRVPIAQEIRGESADRFLILISLSTEDTEGWDKTLPLYNRRFSNPIIGEDVIAAIEVVAHLELEFLDGKKTSSKPFECRIPAPYHAFLPRKRVGVRFEDYLRLLRSDDIAVVESMFASLWGLKEQSILKALSEFDEHHYGQLQARYAEDVYSKVPEYILSEEYDDPGYYPSPEDRIEEFRENLEDFRAIAAGVRPDQ